MADEVPSGGQGVSPVFMQHVSLRSIPIFTLLIICACVPAVFAQSNTNTANNKKTKTVLVESKQTAQIQSKWLKEASGLAISRRSADIIWSHNDSGDQAWVYAFDLKGEPIARVFLKGVFAFDFEDMASFEIDGKPMLLVADVGDNLKIRAVRNLHIIHEPVLEKKASEQVVGPDEIERKISKDGILTIKVNVRETLRVKFEGNEDIEAVAVDAQSGLILLATKEVKRSRIYRIDLKSDHKVQQAKLIGEFKTKRITGMDISRDGQRLVMINYDWLYVWEREKDESWATVFKKEPTVKIKHKLPKCEAVCFDTKATRILYTEEGEKPWLKSYFLKQEQDERNE